MLKLIFKKERKKKTKNVDLIENWKLEGSFQDKPMTKKTIG